MIITENEAPRVRSAEGVELHLPVASPAPRMLAYAIDATLVWVVIGALAVAVIIALPFVLDWLRAHLPSLEHAPVRGEAILLPYLILIVLLGYFGELIYFVLAETVSGGSSLGKYIVGLRVVRVDGLRVDLRSTLIRNLLRAVDILPSTYLLGLTTMVLSPLGQRLGDHAAGTLVVRLDTPERALRPAISSDAAPLSLSRAQLTQLGAAERALVRRALRRAAELEGERRALVLRQSAEALTKKLSLDESLLADPHLLLQRLWLTIEREETR